MITVRHDVGDFAALADERARILEYLASHLRETLGGAAGFLTETTDYLLSSPGKLLRPLLLLDACRAAGGDPDRVFPADAGTESGHIASLVHDDIIDVDTQRRGQASLYAKYDVATALLTGDMLIFQTFLCYTHCEQSGVKADRVLAAIRALSTTCIDMCRGQAVEAEIAGNLDTPEEDYLELVRLKTASFCQAASYIGACLAEASDHVVNCLAEYGHNLGMAFQIMDDILSYDGSALLMGKPLTSDMRNKRVTLPIIYALQTGGLPARRRIQDFFEASEELANEKHAKLVRLLADTRAIDRARGLAYRYTVRAKQQLDCLDCTESRERLRSLADIFLTRDH